MRIFYYLTLALLINLLNLIESNAYVGRKVEDIANPMYEPSKCGRETVTKSAICDPDLILSKENKDEIEGYINAIDNAQIAIVLIDKMNLDSYWSKDLENGAKIFATELHNIWGVGDKDKQDGVLLFLSIRDRAIYVSVGKGLSLKINKKAIQTLINRMKPELRKRNYGIAIINSILDLDLTISGPKDSRIKKAYILSDPLPAEKEESFEEFSGSFIFFILFAGVAGIFIYFNNRKMSNYEKGTIALKKLMKEVEKVEDEKYMTSSCPICLEEFDKEMIKKKQNNHKENNENQPSDNTNDQKDIKEPSGTTLPNHPMSLKCGHIFCFKCLEEYLQGPQGGKCPICREPVEPQSQPQRPSQPHNSSFLNRLRNRRRWFQASPYDSTPHPSHTTISNNLNTPGSQTEVMFAQRAPEIRYRLHRVHTLFPDAVNFELYRTLNNLIDYQTIGDFRSHIAQRGIEMDQHLVQMRQAAQAQASQSGMKGSSRGSFGGGSSYSGGGSRW